ncbi:MAG: bifunctional isocitrate dehydrogenase kinase/phosphatase [Candidatus Eiseniibacteriota bacterium]
MSSSPALPAAAAARVIVEAYEAYLERLSEVVRRAKVHFEARDWRGVQRDSSYRLDLYNTAVQEGLRRLSDRLGRALSEHASWTALREAYTPLIVGRNDGELAETFFNSFTRRVFHTVGVDPAIEFVSPAARTGGYGPPWSHTLCLHHGHPGLAPLFQAVLEAFPFAPGYADLPGDAALIADAVSAHLPGADVRTIELAREVFYRGKGAYLVGQIHTARGSVPLVISLTNPDGRVVADAVLLTADEVSIVFSFARSYFLVAMERPREMVDYLRAIMPRKAIAELYNALGFDKHGKTELYRSVLEYLASTHDRFVVAPGQRGMVMAVFTLPGLDVVFKVIRDRFDYPKTVTPDEVRAAYRMVFRHDRAGRLVDAQEFEHLAFDRERFDPRLLDELLGSCAERVRVGEGRVVISHLYTERRLRPLDVYLREADREDVRQAVIDYGQALRDLAATNVFPGDILLKNFGVSRHGRLIFYDYDELCLLTDCRFRELPPPRDDRDEGAAEPWFYVGERDIFPEEFRGFLGLPGDLLEAFLERHRELLGVAFWQRMQEMHRNGNVLDIFPYRSVRRLRPTPRRPRDAGAVHSA